MQTSLLSLLLVTSKDPTVTHIDRETGNVHVHFVAMPRHDQWVAGHLLGLAVKEWGTLTPEDLPKYATSSVDGPDHVRPMKMVAYFLKMASIEYLNGCPDLQPFLRDSEVALRSQYPTAYHLREQINVLLEMYRRGD